MKIGTLTEQEIIETAKLIAEIRESGVINMFDREGVMYILADEYDCEIDKKDYMGLLEVSGLFGEGRENPTTMEEIESLLA